MRKRCGTASDRTAVRPLRTEKTRCDSEGWTDCHRVSGSIAVIVSLVTVGWTIVAAGPRRFAPPLSAPGHLECRHGEFRKGGHRRRRIDRRIDRTCAAASGNWLAKSSASGGAKAGWQRLQQLGAIDRVTTESGRGRCGCGFGDRLHAGRHDCRVCAADRRGLPRGALITDAGSTKEAIVTAIERQETGRTGGPHFVGSHPLAGDHRTGVGIRPGRFVRRPQGSRDADRGEQSSAVTGKSRSFGGASARKSWK